MDSLIASLQSNHRKNVYCKIRGMLSSPSRFLTPLMLRFRWFAEVGRINYLAHSKPDRAAFSSKYPNVYNRRVMGGATKVSCYTEQVNLIPGSASSYESWRLRKFLDNYYPFLLADLEEMIPRNDLLMSELEKMGCEGAYSSRILTRMFCWCRQVRDSGHKHDGQGRNC